MQLDRSAIPQSSSSSSKLKTSRNSNIDDDGEEEEGSDRDHCSMAQFCTPFSSFHICELPLTMIPPDSDIIAICAFRLKHEQSARTESSGVSDSNAIRHGSTSSPRRIGADSKIVLGVCATQYLGDHRPSRSFFNVYMFHESTLLGYCNQQSESTSENIPKDSMMMMEHRLESFELGFVPLQLTTTTIHNGGVQNQLFLLSGTDRHVHCYFLDQIYFPNKGISAGSGNAGGGSSSGGGGGMSVAPSLVAQYQVREARIENIFPELTELPSSALSIDIINERDCNAVAVGCQNGYISLSVQSKELLPQQQQQQQQQNNKATYNRLLSSPISAVRFFTVTNSPAQSSHPLITALNRHARQTLDEEAPRSANMLDAQLHSLNLLVAESVGRVMMYRDVIHNGLDDAVALFNFTESGDDEDGEGGGGGEFSGSILQDSVLCLHVADINADGINEILVGTYSCKIFVYELERGNEPNGPPPLEDHDRISWYYQLSNCIKCPSPVHAIDALDINNDGVNEVIASTMYALQVIQPNLSMINQKLVSRMDTLSEILSLTEQIEEEEESIISLLLQSLQTQKA